MKTKGRRNSKNVEDLRKINTIGVLGSPANKVLQHSKIQVTPGEWKTKMGQHPTWDKMLDGMDKAHAKMKRNQKKPSFAPMSPGKAKKK